MKYPIQRIFAVLLVLVLAASSLTGMRVNAQEQPTAYVLHYDGQDAKPYLYGSRFEFKHSYNDPVMGKNSVWTYWNCLEIFNLVSAAPKMAPYPSSPETGQSRWPFILFWISAAVLLLADTAHFVSLRAKNRQR